MEKAVVISRFLKNKEIEALTADIYSFPNLVYVGVNVWKKQKAYVTEVNRQFAGVLVAYEFGDWVKLGPLVILKKYQKKGLSKILLKNVISKYKNKNITVNTTNPYIEKIALEYGFKKVPNYFFLPMPVKKFLIGHLLNYSGIKNIAEAIRKALFMPRGKRKYFIRLFPLTK